MTTAAETTLPPSLADLPRDPQPASGMRPTVDRSLPLLSEPQWVVLLNRLASDARRQRSGLAVWTVAIDSARLLEAQGEPGEPADLAQLDAVLATLGQRLGSRVRTRDRVVRLGHGLFGVVVVDVDARLAAAIGQRIIAPLTAPCRLGQQLLVAELRSAAAVCPDEGSDGAALLAHMATQLGAGVAPH
jgi:GGDEF domain-containing protein